jgi:hypothetical protein
MWGKIADLKLCLTVRRFRVTKKKEWKNIRKLERWTEQQEKWGNINATIKLGNQHKVQAQFSP